MWNGETAFLNFQDLGRNCLTKDPTIFSHFVNQVKFKAKHIYVYMLIQIIIFSYIYSIFSILSFAPSDFQTFSPDTWRCPCCLCTLLLQLPWCGLYCFVRVISNSALVSETLYIHQLLFQKTVFLFGNLIKGFHVYLTCLTTLSFLSTCFKYAGNILANSCYANGSLKK